jgi:plastocyanin
LYWVESPIARGGELYVSILSPLRSPAFVALLAVAGVGLIAAACSSGGDGKTPAAGVTAAGDGGAAVKVQMVAGPAFSPRELDVAAGTDVEITAENTAGFHSFAVYESESAAEGGGEPIAQTEACNSPCSESVTVNLAAGEYFFRCEIHPSLMTGTITAQ